MDVERQEANECRSDPVSGEDLADRLRRLAWAQFELNIALARALGMGPNDVWALERLRVEGPLGPVELGHRLGGMTSASATALVDRLEAAGHVQRRRHPSDRRRLVVAPTELAEATGDGAFAPLGARLEEAAADLSDEERAAVARYLDRVVEAINAFVASHRTR
jgi:DNA-binding MarR family transcriptional regulator